MKLVESSIRITKSEIRDGVNLGSAIFQGPVNFMGTNFASEALFSGANFSGHKPYIYLGGSTVGSLELSLGSPDFRESTFSRNANFFKTEFCGDAFFLVPNFTKMPSFMDRSFAEMPISMQLISRMAEHISKELCSAGNIQILERQSLEEMPTLWILNSDPPSG